MSSGEESEYCQKKARSIGAAFGCAQSAFHTCRREIALKAFRKLYEHYLLGAGNV
jgi:hypothetical protein